MPRPFRFGLVAAFAPSRTIWVSIALRAEELCYATFINPGSHKREGPWPPFQR